MSGINFNSTDNKPKTIKDLAYISVKLINFERYNNYNISTGENINIDEGMDVLFTGFIPEYNGQTITITVNTGGRVTFQHLDNGSEDLYKINLTSNGSSDLVIRNLETVVLKYNNIIKKWVLISNSKV